MNNVILLTKIIKDINAIRATVRKQGNGAHVTVPKEWIDKDVIIKLVERVELEAAEEKLKGLNRRKRF